MSFKSICQSIKDKFTALGGPDKKSMLHLSEHSPAPAAAAPAAAAPAPAAPAPEAPKAPGA